MIMLFYYFSSFFKFVGDISELKEKEYLGKEHILFFCQKRHNTWWKFRWRKPWYNHLLWIRLCLAVLWYLYKHHAAGEKNEAKRINWSFHIETIDRKRTKSLKKPTKERPIRKQRLFFQQSQLSNQSSPR